MRYARATVGTALDLRRCAGFENELGASRLPDLKVRLLRGAGHVRVEFDFAALTSQKFMQRELLKRRCVFAFLAATKAGAKIGVFGGADA